MRQPAMRSAATNAHLIIDPPYIQTHDRIT